jgi:hypothetical protein
MGMPEVKRGQAFAERAPRAPRAEADEAHPEMGTFVKK